jgi:DNA-binding MarR family transcriptional regulator
MTDLARQRSQDTLSYLLGLVCKAHHNCANAMLGQVGLYAGQEIFLHWLWNEDGLTQSQLVEQMCVQPATVSKMLRRLEQAGIVERRGDPDDKRVSRVYLTKQSRELRASVEQAWQQLEARLVANLTLEERILLRRLLLQVHQNLTQGE